MHLRNIIPLYHGSTMALPGCTMALLDSTLLYHGSIADFIGLCLTIHHSTLAQPGYARLLSLSCSVIALSYAAELGSNLPHSTMALSDSTRVYPTLSLLYLVLYWNLLPLSTMAGFTGLHLTFLQSVMAPRSITGL